MARSDPQQREPRAVGLAPALFPVAQGVDANAERARKGPVGPSRSRPAADAGCNNSRVLGFIEPRSTMQGRSHQVEQIGQRRMAANI
jgi:hypothetical protein